MVQTILAFFKNFGLIFEIYREKDKKKAEEKAALGKEVVDALAETDKDKRASAINVVIGRMRK